MNDLNEKSPEKLLDVVRAQGAWIWDNWVFWLSIKCAHTHTHTCVFNVHIHLFMYYMAGNSHLKVNSFCFNLKHSSAYGGLVWTVKRICEKDFTINELIMMT